MRSWLYYTHKTTMLVAVFKADIAVCGIMFTFPDRLMIIRLYYFDF